MNITPQIKEYLKKSVWDYAIDEDTLVAIFNGQKQTFSLTKEKLYSRLLLNMNWYTLLECFGVKGLKIILTNDVINLIWQKDLRDKFFYAKTALNELS